MDSCWHTHLMLLTMSDLLWWNARMPSCSVSSFLPNTSSDMILSGFVSHSVSSSLHHILWTRSYLLGEFLFTFWGIRPSNNLHSTGIFLYIKQCLYTLFFVCLFACFSRQDFYVSVYPRLYWNSLYRSGLPQTQKSVCLCLLSTGIKGLSHHAWLIYLFVCV